MMKSTQGTEKMNTRPWQVREASGEPVAGLLQNGRPGGVDINPLAGAVLATAGVTRTARRTMAHNLSGKGSSWRRSMPFLLRSLAGACFEGRTCPRRRGCQSWPPRTTGWTSTSSRKVFGIRRRTCFKLKSAGARRGRTGWSRRALGVSCWTSHLVRRGPAAYIGWATACLRRCTRFSLPRRSPTPGAHAWGL